MLKSVLPFLKNIPSKREIGELSQTIKGTKLNIEWKIENIFSYLKENECYQSQRFFFSDSYWFLQIYPYGETGTNSIGWISIYLLKVGVLENPNTVLYSFGIREVDGRVEKSDYNAVSHLGCPKWGHAKFLLRSELLKKRLKLAPNNNTLTLTCVMRINWEFIARMIKLSENLEDLFISEKECDVTLKVQDTNFPVHRSILIARSSVFKAMFEADMKEKNTGNVSIVDCHPGAFKDFLTYIYSGKFTNSSNNVFELYRIADKYDVEELKADCIQYMVNNLTVDTFLDTFKIGDQFKESILETAVQSFFNRNIACTPTWESIANEHPEVVNILVKNLTAKMKLNTAPTVYEKYSLERALEFYSTVLVPIENRDESIFSGPRSSE